MAQALVLANPGQSLRPTLDQSNLKSGFFTEDDVATRRDSPFLSGMGKGKCPREPGKQRVTLT